MPPPLPGSPKKKALSKPGCVFGCLGLWAVLLLTVVLWLLAALQLPPFAPPREAWTIPNEYFGEWRSVDGQGSEIRIWPDGRLDWQAQGTGNSFDLTGARARLSADGKKLAASLFFFHKQWTVDTPPHPAGGEYKMALDGKVYQRVRKLPAPNTPDRLNI